MKTDIEIARETKLNKIEDIAEKLGVPRDEVQNYGRYIAKVPIHLIDKKEMDKHNLILVSAITPNKAGVGKTTVSIGLSLGLNKIGKKAVVALREPSLGPCFGMKGGAAGGYSQVLPMENINLHFTGDFHAVTSAHNMITALLDNYIYQNRNSCEGLKEVKWKRVLDVNDRSLRNIVSGLGGSANGIPTETGFDITAASEIMAILCLADDMDDLKTFLPGISDITISYTTKSEVDGGDLDEAESYTIAGVKNNYASMSNLTMAAGSFIESSNETNKEKVCVLGYSVAKEIFGSVEDAYDSTIYVDNRAYVVNGVISEVGTVSSGISPDDSIFIPYNTGVKYIVGTDANSTITVIASDVDNVDNVMENIQSVLAENYPNAEFTITDAGSKMEAASESNNTLTTLLIAMAAIVFIVGGIGIMNVLFVSVKERTKEIGILKAIGCTKKDILIEFLLEACFISILGGILGVLLSFGITPIVEYFDVRVELSVAGAVLAVVFAIFTGTVFGFYPALKASKLVPVEALNEE